MFLLSYSQMKGLKMEGEGLSSNEILTKFIFMVGANSPYTTTHDDLGHYETLTSMNHHKYSIILFSPAPTGVLVTELQTAVTGSFVEEKILP